jgi:hypothetical protein
MEACKDHQLAIPVSWYKTNNKELRAMLSTWSKEHNKPELRFQTFPPICRVCQHFEFKPELIRELKGSRKKPSKAEQRFLDWYKREKEALEGVQFN